MLMAQNTHNVRAGAPFEEWRPPLPNGPFRQTHVRGVVSHPRFDCRATSPPRCPDEWAARLHPHGAAQAAVVLLKAYALLRAHKLQSRFSSLVDIEKLGEAACHLQAGIMAITSRSQSTHAEQVWASKQRRPFWQAACCMCGANDFIAVAAVMAVVVVVVTELQVAEVSHIRVAVTKVLGLW